MKVCCWRLPSWDSLRHGALGRGQGLCLHLLGSSDCRVHAGTCLRVAAGVVPAVSAATVLLARPAQMNAVNSCYATHTLCAGFFRHHQGDSSCQHAAGKLT
jgi:hypothetical protein